jgi:molybdopterin molybdotransferase
VLVTFELFVRPAVNALLGVPDPLPEYRRGILPAPVGRNPHRDEFLRARTRREGDSVLVEPVAGRESHMIVRAGRADALIAIEAGEGEVSAGEEIRYLALA